MPTPAQWAAARARAVLLSTLRQWFTAERFLEVDVPLLVPHPGLEPHIDPFEVPFVPGTDVGAPRALYLHTSPEYAMKRLLADSPTPIFFLGKVFRNGEIAPAHNPEFTLLEFYRPNADYTAVMADTEASLCAAAVAVRALAGTPRSLLEKTPYERMTVDEAFAAHAGFHLPKDGDVGTLMKLARGVGVRTESSDTYDDVFFRVMLDRVEPALGKHRPVFLTEYPASMASLARLKPGNSQLAERVELYAGGHELGNGFSELTDAAEQRRRLLGEQAFRRAHGRPVFELDERFLAALPLMPPSSGIAIGVDRVLMLALGATRIEDVLLFPARDFF